MNKEEYFGISREQELPLRCPILNYCERRASTIYLFSAYYKFKPRLSMTEALIEDGVIPSDFSENQIPIQGEAPTTIPGNDHFYFSKVCPEVNLFDNDHSMIPGKACIEGAYDKYFKGDKNKVISSQHFSECPEFNKYIFDGKGSQKRKKQPKRKPVPNKIKALLQKEIQSECPFCRNEDVDHFQIHHIDNDPQNNLIDNLLMLCPNCHSKITKGDITEVEVVKVKNDISKS